MGKFVDLLTDLGVEAGKDIVKDTREEWEVRNRIGDYINRQAVTNELSMLSEEVDFGGLSQYFQTTLLKDVQIYLFGRNSEREAAHSMILNKACAAASADIASARHRITRITEGALEILYGYYREQIDHEQLFVANEIIDAIVRELKRQGDASARKPGELVMAEEKSKQTVLYQESSDFKRVHQLVRLKYIKRRYSNVRFTGQQFDAYSDLFKLIISITDNGNEIIKCDSNIFQFTEDIICNHADENLIKIKGADGTGKSTFLSILYWYLYEKCKKNGFNIYPFYINLHYYDTKICEDNVKLTKELMDKDLCEVEKLMKDYPELPFIFIIDGTENYFRSTLKTARYLKEYLEGLNGHKKIVCIGEKTNVHSFKDRSQNTYFTVRMLYDFRFRTINNDEVNRWTEFLECFGRIEGNSELLGPIKSFLQKLDLDEVDLNILSVIKECYDSDMIAEVNSISGLYRNYCLSYLGTDEDSFLQSAKMSYEYFMTKKKFTQEEIFQNNKEWNLIHQHKTISNFLIAYYFVNTINNLREGCSTKELECIFPRDINLFIKSLINEEFEPHELLQRDKLLYEQGGILAKSQSLYMMGRIKARVFRNEVVEELEKHYGELEKQLSDSILHNNKKKEKDACFLLRSVIISLIQQGDRDKVDVYMDMLLNSPVANSINRGFHLEYYGDIQRVPDGDLYYDSDDGLKKMDATYHILIGRVKKRLLNKVEDVSFQIELFTLCSLMQVRLNKNKLKKQYIEEIMRMVDITLQKEENYEIELNRDFKAYLTMLKEDIDNKEYMPRHIYDKLYGVKDIVRKGWVNGIRTDVTGKPYENVAEHIYYTWMLGMLYLPEAAPKEKEYKDYDKRKILDMILIHDWAEVDVGDVTPVEDSQEHRDLEDFRMRILLMHDTYHYVGNMAEYKKLWKIYGKQSPDINGRVAYDLDKIQAIYQFYQYCDKGTIFREENRKNWLAEKNKVTTSIGKMILKEVVLDRFEV